MVPRPLAPARAMRSRTCAYVIQPCQLQLNSFGEKKFLKCFSKQEENKKTFSTNSVVGWVRKEIYFSQEKRNDAFAG